jgi:transmembrane sensor
MSMTKQPADIDPERWEALARYLAGESTAEEAAAMQRWLAEDPARGALAESLGSTLDRAAFAAPADLDVEAALARVKNRFAEPEVEVLPLRAQEPARRGWNTTLFRTAATIVVLLGAGLWWRTSREGVGTPDASIGQSFSTMVGTTDTVNLSDGTSVILGPDTHLTLAKAYGETERAVELEGEAFFTVVHDATKPFTVRAGKAIIKDLGTSFAVRTDADGPVRVAVTAGSVHMRAADASEDTGVLLSAGDRGVLSSDGTASALGGGVPDSELAWTRGTLVFEDAPLDRVKQELKRWYGIELQVPDAELAKMPITATFDRQPVETVLNVISLTLGGKLVRRGNTATIRR